MLLDFTNFIENMPLGPKMLDPPTSYDLLMILWKCTIPFLKRIYEYELGYIAHVQINQIKLFNDF